jgi:hypothetical protein
VDPHGTKYFLYPVILPAITGSSEVPVVEVRNVRVKQL